MTPPTDRTPAHDPALSSSEWSDRCSELFESLRRPAHAMVSRAFGRALTEEEAEDVYAAAWAATLAALRGRGDRMSDEELRAYVLTAVASQARKELRRRARRPSVALEPAHEQAVADVHVPLPDEAAISAESAGVARDLLSSLPPRRRAVMLLRYGWGLAPGEVCSLISGLSPRAYRKEVTRGVEQLIERLGQHESGEWCRSREPILRDYIAGTAGEDERRQIEHHLGHCRACSAFASRLTGHLHDFGSGLAVASLAGLIGGHRMGLAERFGELIESGRTAATHAVERTEMLAGALAASGGAKGGGALGAGLAAKVATGGGVKAALACVGTGAAATACVAAGIVPVPGVDLNGSRDGWNAPESRRAAEPRPAPPARVTDPILEVPAESPVEQSPPTEPDPVEEPAPPVAPEPEAPAPVDTPVVVEEFDPVAGAEPAPPVAPEPAPAPATDGSGQGSGSVAGNEFGP